MGNTESTKVDFRNLVVEETSKLSSNDNDLDWEKLLPFNTINDLFNYLSATDVRALRDMHPNALATLINKVIYYLACLPTSFPAPSEHKKIINCIRLLIRVIPFLFEESEWRNYFWSIPEKEVGNESRAPLGSSLLNALSHLLFCPNFTVGLRDKNTHIASLSKIDSCEYIWQAGVGFAGKPPSSAIYDTNRTEILKLLLVCFSEIIYTRETDISKIRWITCFTSAENRNVLPIFTSLLNTICSYDPVGLGVPYNHLLLTDFREPLVKVSLQFLIVCLDKDSHSKNEVDGYAENYFVNYLSRIHREEDFDFILKGFTRLLNNQLQATYFPGSLKKIEFHQELLVLLWKCCEFNQKFLYFILKTSDMLDILVPILYHLNDSRTDPSRIGLVHMSVFLILLLSGERNFGVRLNKPFTSRGIIDVPIFTGTHADLLIIVFHKLITSGNHKLQSLFDCLLTIIVNVSPYLKSLSMVTANKLVHLVEAFSTPWFMFSSPTNHHLIFFILEMFNNIIQYQFDGNSNLIYTIIRKRQVFYQLSNIQTDSVSIAQGLRKGKKPVKESEEESTVEIIPISEKDELKASTGPSSTLARTPSIGVMTKNFEAKEGKSEQQQPLVKGENSQDKTENEKKKDDEEEEEWIATPEWVESWKNKLPLQTIMRMLQILVPQVEKICIDKGLTDESEILKFLQHGTLVGLLPVPHPILIRRYIANEGTNNWFRTYTWGVIYLKNVDPAIWYDTEIFLKNDICNAYYKFYNVILVIYSIIMSYNYLFKIVVVGDHNVGKSCILLRFAENAFRADHISTLGVDFKLKTIKIGRDKIRDTAGMERYRTIYNSYYHSAHGVVCVFDITNEKSFENLENYWLTQVKEHAPQNAVLLLVGNKADMEPERKIPFDRAERLAKRLGVSLFEVSAKTGINCEDAFVELATVMRDRLLASAANSDSDDSDRLSTAFHIDGAISHEKMSSRLMGVVPSCCSGESTPRATFV
ncbi:hypothetical protein Mgra_00000973 [Meloidogyne graminicola]|uniref:Uncharacterized protein n=1 Tax=Meloidogyne graminicola TaxID=189291 RepID=A0A8T0A2N9_9BILA|nr:hypothetical protein Mgra_00000973 [Meloidogyne graminicola]